MLYGYTHIIYLKWSHSLRHKKTCYFPEEKRESLFNGREFQLRKDLETEGDGGSNVNTLELNIFKMANVVNFMLCICYHNF
jgi:hypothetical protein